MTAAPFLPYGRHLIEDDDVAAVERVLRGPALTTGPAVVDFEKVLAAACGAPHAMACSSGTAALHLAALALDLGPGDAAVVPSVTFLATANAMRYVGADVIFADVDPDTGLLTAAGLEDALKRAQGRRVKAVFPVHLAGQCAQMTAIAPIARRAGLKIVEDACHALGADCDGRPVGACADSDMAVFSFHPVKTIAMGEGGAIAARDAVLAEKLRALRSHGMVRDPARFEIRDQAFEGGEVNPWYYEMPAPGFNYRASDIHCALGLSQMKKLDRFVAERRRLADLYVRLLAPLAPVVRPLPRVSWCRPAWHLNVVLIDFAAAGVSRGRAMRALAGKGIGSQVHYLPVHRQPYYRRLYGDPRLPGADAYYERALSLPLFVGLTDADVARVVTALAAALGL
ncbi:MAG: UDP-4-amino-4,6-dideoxy-N-acetyl-beta-L-altrosamine transaminase, partial [Alphaproteobacteria bacterium]|nr:UDP-4-amino-4,6-dideoxy-N-acetyl-beta-L-altrosamine transaminase [Alphaproteobacteria bacterium]